MKLNVREKMLLLALVGFLVLYLGIRFLLTPAWSSLSKSSVQLANVEAQRQTASANVAAAANIPKAKQAAQNKAALAAKALLPEMSKEDIHQYVVPLAQAQGLNVTALVLNDPFSADIGITSSMSSPVPDYSLKMYAQRANGQRVTSSASSMGTSSAAGAAQNTGSSVSGAGTSSAPGTASGKSGTVLAYTVTITANGTLAQANAFSDAIKNTGRTILVNSVQFSQQNGTGSMTISLTFYCAQKLDGQTDALQ
ncbi:MAG: hypothetical protein ABF904_12570 [Ethanoligenens sp.]